jgi:dTDP-4-amino-4,6-dideoxygalactose transaminase
MHVPLLDLTQQYSGSLRQEIEQGIREVCESQQFVLGPRVTELEERVAEYSHAKHGIGVSSGTDALLLALMAFGIGPGHDVITSPYTFFATGGVIARLGARPVFCDIDADTFNLSPAAVKTFLDENCSRASGQLVNRQTGNVVRAIIPVHLYGQMADMDALIEIARAHELVVIEDAAQAIGSALADGRRAGSVGDIGCLSFFPTKNLGAFGDAGMCVTNDAALAEKLRILRVHGGQPKYYHSVIGGNFRIDALQAAILLPKLRHLDAWTVKRQSNAAHYDALFAAAGVPGLVKPKVCAGFRHIFNQYVIRVANRDALRAFLQANGIGTEIYYPLALHQQECFAYLQHEPGDFPESTRAASETLALPIYPELTHAQLDFVVDRIGAFYRQ